SERRRRADEHCEPTASEHRRPAPSTRGDTVVGRRTEERNERGGEPMSTAREPVGVAPTPAGPGTASRAAGRTGGRRAGRGGPGGAGTRTLARPERDRGHPPVWRPSTVWVAFLAAATAALAGLAVTGAVVLVGWGLAPSRASATGAVRLAGQAWMLAHHGRLQLPLGDVGLTPLGLTLLPAWLLFRAGGSVHRSLSFDQAEHATPATAAKAVAALAGTYAVLVVLGTGLASTDAVQVEPVSTLAGAGLLATVAGAPGLP